MPVFTTSRKPCARTRTFVKELARIIPNSIVFGRGKQSVDDVVEHARQEGYSRVAIVTEMHGNPQTLRVLSVSESEWNWIEEFHFKSVKLSREFGERVKKPTTIMVETKSKFASSLGITSEESDTILQDSLGTITFLQDGKEVGPRIVSRGKK